MPPIFTPGQLTHHAEFYHQLGAMLSAGVPLPQALRMARAAPAARSLHELCGLLLEQLEQGATLHEALRRLGRHFPSFDIALLHAGELSGRLDACFKLLAQYYRERAQLLRSVIGDLAYPAFVLHAAVFIFPFPKLFLSGDVLAYAGQTLGWLAPLYVLVFLVILACQGRHGEDWRALVERLLHAVPVLGRARRQLALARLAAALEALVTAGVLIIPAWELAAAASGSPALRRTVSTWRTRLEAGDTPAELVRRSPEFPELFANLYRTGELSGQLDDTLRRLHTLYGDEASRKLKAVAQWTPRAIYLAIALGVAYKIVSFYAGYFSQLNQVLSF
ncbi:MAG: type II secretion system F family protein [Verrucomicrobia bacterium]|nr:type II secretion system F family protein [Verrucomicrobiota bacterium]